jgi:prevent-host-death family protein
VYADQHIAAQPMDGSFGANRAAETTRIGHNVLQKCYSRSMPEVPSRDLRNDTAGVLRRVQAGEDITITVRGRPVALLTPVRPKRRRWLTAAEFLTRLQRAQADPGLRADLAILAGDTTDDLGPLK